MGLRDCRCPRLRRRPAPASAVPAAARASLLLLTLLLAAAPAGCRDFTSVEEFLGTGTVVATEVPTTAAPAVWGDRVVWRGRAEGVAQLKLHDVRTGETRFVARGPGPQLTPDIWEDRVVWVDRRLLGVEGDHHIFLADLAADTVVRLTRGAAVRRAPLSVHGDLVAWEELGSDGRFDVVVHDLAAGREAHRQRGAFGPALSDGRAAWFEAASCDVPPCGNDLVILDVRSGERLRFPAGGVGQNSLGLGNRWAVWADPTAARRRQRVVALELASGRVLAIGRGDTEERRPAHSGDHVLWVEGSRFRAPNGALRLRRLPDGRIVPLDDELRNASPDLWRDRAVWLRSTEAGPELVYRKLGI